MRLLNTFHSLKMYLRRTNVAFTVFYPKGMSIRKIYHS